MIEEPAFLALPEEEKKVRSLLPQRRYADEIQFWHSHKYEVESGMLILASKALVPSETSAFGAGP